MKKLLFTCFVFLNLVLLAQYDFEISEQRLSINASLAPFYHGVASGDPTPNAVVIWTRITSAAAFEEVEWRVATDTGMVNIVQDGMFTTDASKDFTVKIDVVNLAPNSTYYYEFSANGINSVRGRTKTTAIGDVDSLRFAVVSCSNFAHGYFNAYNRITARNDIDAILHLGDYIYEYGDGEYGNTRALQPQNEILSLADYRMRYSHYRLDSDLMRMHQQYPMMMVWDDHETANDSWFGGAQNHDPNTEGLWGDRKSAGIQAYMEWMPIRMPDPNDDQRIYRKASYGDLADIYLMDTRLEGRDEQDGTGNTNATRTILGQEQYNWFTSELSNSSARWKIMAQQVMMAPLKVFGQAVNGDQWDGYPAERNNLHNHILSNNISNFVVLTGDIHTSWGNDLPSATYNSTTQAGSVGVEFVTTSVTSPGLDFLGGLGTNIVKLANPHVKFVDLTKHGYLILDINKTRTQGDWYFLDDVEAPNSNESFGAGWFCNNGTRYLQQANTPSVPHPSKNVTAAPLDPRLNSPVAINNVEQVLVLGLYPNPMVQEISLQFYVQELDEFVLQLVDQSGKVVFHNDFGKLNIGLVERNINLPDLASGMYFLVLKSSKAAFTKSLIKQ